VDGSPRVMKVQGWMEIWCMDVSSLDDSSHELFVPNSTKMLFNCLLEAGLMK